MNAACSPSWLSNTIAGACQAITALEPAKLLGGSLVASNAERNIFQTLEVFHALKAFNHLELSVPGEPASAALEGFVTHLGEFWYDAFGTVPEGEFGSASENFAPIEKTAAAFVVDALASTTWKFSYQRVKAAFETMQTSLTERWEEGDLPEPSGVAVSTE